MTERSRFWDGSATGDAVSITDDELMDRFFRALLNGTGNQGVLKGWLNELEVTDGGALNASVDTGGGILYGLFYQNDAAATVALPNNSTVWVVVRRDWATPQARLTQVAALVQNPGVTYDIPLAQVTTLAGIITLITDGRDFCEFSTILQDNVVETDHIQNDAVTTAKLENQARSVYFPYGAMEPDATNPPTNYPQTTRVPYFPAWSFSAAALNTIWVTFRVPSDISSATMTLYVWNSPGSDVVVAGDVLWGWSSWDAQPSAVLANQAGTLAIANDNRLHDYMYRDALTTLTLSAGDIVHMEVYRDGAAGGDTLGYNSFVHLIELEYTADS